MPKSISQIHKIFYTVELKQRVCLKSDLGLGILMLGKYGILRGVKIYKIHKQEGYIENRYITL